MHVHNFTSGVIYNSNRKRVDSCATISLLVGIASGRANARAAKPAAYLYCLQVLAAGCLNDRGLCGLNDCLHLYWLV